MGDSGSGITSLAAQGFGQLTGTAQLIGGFISARKANANLNNLFKKRKAFKTPAEIFDILNMAESNASTGFGPETLDYLTTGANSALSAGLGTASRLGADPNTLSTLLDNYSRDIFRIGGENELVKMKKYDGVLNALQLVASNKEAEWLSSENLIKDQMQAEAQKLQAANTNIQSGLNLVTNATAAAGSANSYRSNSSVSSITPSNQYGNNNPTLSGLQGLSPTKQMKLKQLIDSGILD